MSQLLAVSGADAPETAAVFHRALELFSAMHGLQPHAQAAGAGIAAAAFPRLAGSPAPVWRDPTGACWTAAAGSVFCGDLAGEAALGRVAEGGREGLAERLADADGSFAIVRADCTTGELLAITDRIGTIHLYGGGFCGCEVVCTSSLLLAALLQPEWDTVSCREFIAMGTVFEQRTLFRGIEKLAPASVFGFRGGRRTERRRYWDLGACLYDRSERRGTVGEMADALVETTARIVKWAGEPVFDLTGGLDSRAVVSAALHSGNRFTTTVTGEATDPDVAAAARVAKAAGLELLRISPRFDAGEWWSAVKAALRLCDGEYEVLEYARILEIHRQLSRRFQASVNGSNGEICKGYWWELLFPFTGRRGHFDAAKVAAARFVLNQSGTELLAAQYPQDLVRHFAEVIGRANAELDAAPNTAQMDHIYLTLRMQRWQGRIASATDRVWPCLSPFLFRAPMEAALSAPPRVRVRNRMSRRVIERLNPALAALPLTEGYPALPVRLTTLPRFVRPAAKLAGHTAERVFGRRPSGTAGPGNPILPLWGVAEMRDILDPRRMASAGLYRPDRLRDFLARSQGEHFADFQVFGRILTLELAARARDGRPLAG